MNLKHILLITLFTLPNLMYAQETFCDGEWVEQITSYTCSSFQSRLYVSLDAWPVRFYIQKPTSRF